MMTNKALASAFDQLARLMELHGENPFKIRSYQSAYRQLRNMPEPIADMTDEQIKALKGVGGAIAGKIRELLDGGEMKTLERYKEKTPEGVQEMLAIKGFGPKKVRSIWKELGIETLGELLYACNENRLVELKGFGLKTQEQLGRQLEYALNSRGRFHYATAEVPADEVLSQIRALLKSGQRAELAGAMRRGDDTVEKIEILIGAEQLPSELGAFVGSEAVKAADKSVAFSHSSGIPVILHTCRPEAFGSEWLTLTGSDDFLNALMGYFSGGIPEAATEEAIFYAGGIPAVPAMLRTGAEWVGKEPPRLVTESDIRGIVHSHSTWSDGLNSLQEMAEATRDFGYEYLVITDHSQAAFYANGLKIERVKAQWEEIEALNEALSPFHIFKGIESDILSDGSLDYPDHILEQFDVVIASVHSNLRMDREKATERILRAVAHPCTTILGHPTGRLLLVREGYPLDHEAVIDACAEHGVSIELNAHPWRLDLDWSWIPYALEQGVRISINPDAHSIGGLRDVRYGVVSAQKGGLGPDKCLNALSRSEFEAHLIERRNQKG